MDEIAPPVRPGNRRDKRDKAPAAGSVSTSRYRMVRGVTGQAFAQATGPCRNSISFAHVGVAEVAALRPQAALHEVAIVRLVRLWHSVQSALNAVNHRLRLSV